MAKQKPWAEVRGSMKRKYAVPGSAFATLQERVAKANDDIRSIVHHESAGKRDEEQEQKQSVREQMKGRKTTTPQKGKTIPKSARVKKPTKSVKKRERRTHRIADEDDSDDNLPPEPIVESWRPYGGDSAPVTDAPTACLGIARISSWRVVDFKAAFRRKLKQYGTDGSAEIATKELEYGGESQTDISARFGDEAIAEQVQTDLDGEVMMGRKLQVNFA